MATSADWNMWLGQGQNRQVDPLAPLNQQFGGSLTGAPAQGYGQTSINTPGQLGDPGSAGMWNRAYTQGDRDNRVLADDWNKWRTEPITPTIPQQASFGSMGQQQGQGESMGGGQDWSYAKAASEPQLVNPKTGGAGGTPTATGWTDTSVPDLTLQSDNAANKPKGPGATGVFANDQWVNEAGNRFDYGDATQAPGRARAGTALAKGAVKTWVNYDGSRDTQLHDYNGIDQETSWRRVNRWTQEGVAEHGLTPQEAHNAALARLKRDFELTNLDWRNSGFDLSNVQSAAPGQDWAKANAVGAVPAVDPKTGQPKVADPKIDPVTGKPKVETKVDPKTGLPQTDTTPQDTGGGGGKYNPYFANDVTIDYARGDADAALAAIRQARGGRDMSGPVGKYVESQMTRALQAYLTMYDAYGNKGTDAVSRGNSGVDSLIAGLTNGQGIGDQLRGQASGMLDGMDWSGMDNEQIYNLLSLAGGAGTFGTSPVAQYQMKNALSDMADRMYQQGNTGADPTNAVLASRQGRGNFDDILAKFLAAQQGG